MKQTITCRICNLEFKSITSAHLKSHNISVKDYRQKYDCHVYSEHMLFQRSLLKKTRPQKEILDHTNAVQCRVCNEFHRVLNLHIKYKHNMSTTDYLKLYHNAELYSQSIKDKMKENAFMKNMKGVSLEERLGEDIANKIKSSLSEKAKVRQLGSKRSEGYKEKMRQTWDIKRDEWSASIKKHAGTEERRKKMSKIMKEKMLRDGFHLARGKETSLEKHIRELLTELGFSVIKQKGTKKETLSTIRFFDIYVPEINLVIEADGEFWHSHPERIAIDRAKTLAAIEEGYEFLRISDIEFKVKKDNLELLQSLLKLSKEDKLAYSNNLIARRENKITEQECQLIHEVV